MSYRRIGTLKNIVDMRAHVERLGLNVPMDDQPLSASQRSPLAAPLVVGGFHVGNRWTVQPMEGWDGTPDGLPTEATVRRWRHFGESGAKLIWGGEAFAVQPDGRANPRQLHFSATSESGLAELLSTLTGAHKDRFGPAACDDLLVGLQLTHSGRFSKPHDNDRPEPRIAYHHPLLDARLNIAPDDDGALLSDGDVRRIIASYVDAAKLAHRVGFHFVDIKHCHGYLGHEFLSAYTRPGPYGGDFGGRTRFLREIIEGVRAECPGLMIGVRLSVFDMPPFQADSNNGSNGKLGPGRPEALGGGDYPSFGCNRENPLVMDLTEPVRLLKMMRDELDVAIVNLSAGSPYYNPHIQRPAYFPPTDGYQPPEDPLVGCMRQMQAVRQVRQQVPGLPIVGSAYSYFQEYIPHVAQAAVREGWVDFVGLGRSMLSYWDLPADVLEGKPLKTKLFCRTFSDCTSAPRNGIVSGCYPLDHYYKTSDDSEALQRAKAELRKRLLQHETATVP